jgi:hypothetical protein
MDTAQVAFVVVVLPEVTWPEVTSPEVTWPEVAWKYVLRMSGFLLRFFYYGSSTSAMAIEIDWRSRDPFGIPFGVHMRHRKLRNVRPSGIFWPEVTSSPIGLPLENMGARMRDWKCPLCVL